MNYEIIITERFKGQLKKIAKKYPSIKEELISISIELSSNPSIGDSLGNNCYKIRLQIKSKNKGKRSGARIISYLVNEKKEVYLLTIYDKSDLESVSNKDIKKLIENIQKKI